MQKFNFSIGTHFFKKMSKKYFFWRVGDGGRKLIFAIVQMVSLIFCPKLSYKAKIPLINVNKKKPWGVNFFHFLRVQNPYVQNFGFGTGVAASSSRTVWLDEAVQCGFGLCCALPAISLLIGPSYIYLVAEVIRFCQTNLLRKKIDCCSAEGKTYQDGIV